MSWLPFRAVRELSGQRGSNLTMLYAIAERTSDETGYAPVGVPRLARDCRVQVREAQYIIGRLVEAGELVVIMTPGRASRYAIPLYPGEPGYNPMPCAEAHRCNGNHTPLSVNRQDQDAEALRRRRSAVESRLHRETKKQPTPPDTLSWPAASDIDDPHPTDTAGELGRRDDRRHAEAAANAEALRWSERTRRRFPTPAERRHAYALDQGFTDWPALVADRAERFARLEAHA